VLEAGWSADGMFVVTASFDGTARVWDAARGDLLAVLSSDRSWLLGAGFSPVGTRVVTARVDAVVEIWDLPRRAPPAEELERLVRCRAPYDTVGDQIVPRTHQPADCR